MRDDLSDETRCRVCGCSDSNACSGGCYWIEPDLCNKCVNSENEVLVLIKQLPPLNGVTDEKIIQSITAIVLRALNTKDEIPPTLIINALQFTVYTCKKNYPICSNCPLISGGCQLSLICSKCRGAS